MDKLPLIRMTELIGIRKARRGLRPEGPVRDADHRSGEFLHAAPWNSGHFGNSNAQPRLRRDEHRQRDLAVQPGAVGDPVVTTGSSKGIEQGNGYTDWDISYAQYQKGSAL